ncbi:MAG: DegT/DnrJ/EryC1/StrS family aminotransferase [Sedimentisphaerales bacterium]|nr:DegT/DnrJ/EryC1/StrS family aminotransferase [Sedimentisphaerales bacterium]
MVTATKTMSDQRIDWWNIQLGDEEAAAVTEAIRNRCISQSTLTAKFESQLAETLGVPYVVCTTSGTSALMMAYMAAGIAPGDEVIIPNRTAVATAHAAMILGATVVPIDVRPEASIIDETLIESAITDRTRLIVPVHMNGKSCNMNAILKTADQYHLQVIEDACQGLLSRYNGIPQGTIARWGCFSLGLAKVVATGQGGAVCCHTEEDYILMKRLRNQGVNDTDPQHNYNMLAGNFKFNDILSAIGIVQLDKIEAKLRRQREIHDTYRHGLQGLKSIRFVPVDTDHGEIPLRAECVATEREKLLQDLKEYRIHTIAHVCNINEMPHIGGQGPYPNSDFFSRHLMLLPCGPDQPLENVKRTIDVLKELDERYQPF